MLNHMLLNLYICFMIFTLYLSHVVTISLNDNIQGRIRGGGVHSPKIGKYMIFWRKIVIFHTKYSNNFRASLHSAQFFLSAPPNLKSRIRP